MIRFDLKQAILEWMFENKNNFQIVNSCVEEFHDYIFGKDGNYLKFGGEDVYAFISEAYSLLFKDF